MSDRSQLAEGGFMALAGKLKALPGIGEAVSGAMGAYHLGAAVYDGTTGDRDGAINHGVQGTLGMLGMIPGVNQSLAALETGTGIAGAAGKAAGAASGRADLAATPASFPELAGNHAVMLTNAQFGKDDTNWYAPGTTPQGTRRGEMGAGLTAMLGPAAWVADAVGDNPLGNLAGDLLGTPRDAPSSGAGPATPAQETGQYLSKLFGGLF